MLNRLRPPRRVTEDSIDEGDAPTEEKAETSSEPERKTVRLQAEVTSMPKVNRGTAGNVTSATFEAKVRFKGTVTIQMRGSVASAYWSVTPGMTVLMSASETGDKVYLAESIDIIASV